MSGATACEQCEAGFYRTTVTTMMEDNGSLGGVCRLCPSGAVCQTSPGARLYAPADGFWVPTGAATFFATADDSGDDDGGGDNGELREEVFRCPRLTCKGSYPEASECWDLEPTPSGSEGGILLESCDADALLCVKGATGPLCG